MFQTLFRYPKVRARHEHSPLATERRAYLSHRADLGSPKSTLRKWANELLVVCRELRLSAPRTVSPSQIRHAAQRWAKRQRRRGRARTCLWAQTLFVQTATAWLKFTGRLRERPIRTEASQPWLDRFVDHLQDAGKAPTTRTNYGWQVRHFLHWWKGQGRPLRQLRLGDLDRYFKHLSRRGWGRVSLATTAKALRQFLRFVEQRRGCSRGLAAAIESPRLYRHESLPAGPAWSEVQRLLRAVDTSRPQDIRNHALFLFLACYGFRCREVTQLRLTDLDWEQGRIRLRRAKSNECHEYPLSAPAASAVLAYLQKVRPRSQQPEVFLTLKAPYRRLSGGAVYHVTQSWLSQLKIASRRQGPHVFRHACATHLLSQGFSLKAIGDHLGHRSVSATQVYAKVDMVALRQVADLDLGGLL